MPDVTSPQSLTNCITIKRRTGRSFTNDDYITLKHWLIANTEADYVLRYDRVTFESEKDAIMFSLRFG